MIELILASGSPRRKELLHQVGLQATITKPDVNEQVLNDLDPEPLVRALAEKKGNAVEIEDNQVILSADTVVSFENHILTKPDSKQEAFQMLSHLRGNAHVVHTGVMIRSNQQKTLFAEQTVVQFWDVTDEEINSYIESGEWKDKAGGYGIQSKGAFLVKEIQGDYYNVVGLPVSRVIQELKKFGVSPIF